MWDCTSALNDEVGCSIQPVGMFFFNFFFTDLFILSRLYIHTYILTICDPLSGQASIFFKYKTKIAASVFTQLDRHKLRESKFKKPMSLLYASRSQIPIYLLLFFCKWQAILLIWATLLKSGRLFDPADSHILQRFMSLVSPRSLRGSWISRSLSCHVNSLYIMIRINFNVK